MKFKSLITTTLALGVIASTGANFNTNEASAAAKQLDKSSSSLHHGYSKINVPYSITVNGTSTNILSSLTFNKNQNISYKDLENKVKSVLKSNRGISDIDLRLSKQAKYTVYFKNGTKRVIDLKSGVYNANLINTSDIKSININVDTKKHVKDKVKANYQVPYSVNLNGTSTNILSNLSFSNKPWINYKNLTTKVKSVLKYDRGISERDLKHAKKAYYTVYFKNGGKRVIYLNSKDYTANLVHAKDVKKIEITVKTASKAKAESYVPYTIAVNGTSTPTLSKLKISNKQNISYKFLNAKVKSVLKHDRGISDIDLRLSKQANYTVHFKNGSKKVVDLKSDVYTANLINVKDIKSIEINVKQNIKSNKEKIKSNKVNFPVKINGFSNLVSNEFVFYNPSKITINDLNLKLKSALANDQGVKQYDIDGAEFVKYKVYFKDGSSKVVDLKVASKSSKVFKATDIKKVDIELKF
ncbi:MAP domain-containing protein [Staphylococcus aureus]|nr:MAP domain-containing protein [Staphylococcus aureus]